MTFNSKTYYSSQYPSFLSIFKLLQTSILILSSFMRQFGSPNTPLAHFIHLTPHSLSFVSYYSTIISSLLFNITEYNHGDIILIIHYSYHSFLISIYIYTLISYQFYSYLTFHVNHFLSHQFVIISLIHVLNCLFLFIFILWVQNQTTEKLISKPMLLAEGLCCLSYHHRDGTRSDCFCHWISKFGLS